MAAVCSFIILPRPTWKIPVLLTGMDKIKALGLLICFLAGIAAAVILLYTFF